VRNGDQASGSRVVRKLGGAHYSTQSIAQEFSVTGFGTGRWRDRSTSPGARKIESQQIAMRQLRTLKRGIKVFFRSSQPVDEEDWRAGRSFAKEKWQAVPESASGSPSRIESVMKRRP